MYNSFLITVNSCVDYGLSYVKVIEYSSLPENISFTAIPFHEIIKFSVN
jgi:hypothetical protein